MGSDLPTEATRRRLEERLRKEYDIPEPEPVADDTFEGQLACDVMDACGGGWDSMEVGYPEKFVSMQGRWEVTKLHRFGRFADVRLFPDEDLLTAVAGLRETSQTMLTTEANTAHAHRRRSPSSAWRAF